MAFVLCKGKREVCKTCRLSKINSRIDGAIFSLVRPIHQDFLACAHLNFMEKKDAFPFEVLVKYCQWIFDDRAQAFMRNAFNAWPSFTGIESKLGHFNCTFFSTCVPQNHGN